MNDKKFTNWDSYWLVNFERLNIFFDYLYTIRGLSSNSINSYKDDFKSICLYVWDKNWFIENIDLKKKPDYSRITSKEEIKSELLIENFTHKIRKCEMRAQYEQFCYTNKLTAIRMNIFDAELEATYLFMQKRTTTVRLWVFNRNSVIEKLKKMGLLEQQNFLEDDD